jgi:hypothetical protein
VFGTKDREAAKRRTCPLAVYGSQKMQVDDVPIDVVNVIPLTPSPDVCL